MKGAFEYLNVKYCILCSCKNSLFCVTVSMALWVMLSGISGSS